MLDDFEHELRPTADSRDARGELFISRLKVRVLHGPWRAPAIGGFPLRPCSRTTLTVLSVLGINLIMLALLEVPLRGLVGLLG